MVIPRQGPYPTSFTQVYNKDRHISEFFCKVKKKKYMLAVSQDSKAWGKGMQIHKIIKRKPGVNDWIDNIKDWTCVLQEMSYLEKFQIK